MVQYVSYGKGQPTWATKPHTRQCSTGGQVVEWWRVRPWIKWSLVRSPSGRKSSCHCLMRAENGTEVYTLSSAFTITIPSSYRSLASDPIWCHYVTMFHQRRSCFNTSALNASTMHHHRVRITVT